MIIFGIILLIIGFIIFGLSYDNGEIEDSFLAIVGIVLIIIGILLAGFADNQRKKDPKYILYYRNKEIKDSIEEINSQRDRFKYLQYLKKENNILEDSLKQLK